ncbi:hypothetical protein TOPH_07468 [Tolypocladium ophioglossoides CBS 100239]|uniref:Uncharacterized protein n=1 Tax=Tolypocladium ophioglossoides (strain CBS 100239) TaxID=1163406 RepID=A0A0L0N197_TOLOC|nr:hypothetical protein TOPH_07468 [Tolypocladium ophioglossoides CBS 100239]
MSYFLQPTVSVPLEPRTESLPSSQKIRQGRKPSSNRRTSSWSGWVRNIFPSHRPERGGTRKDKGFWEREDLTNHGQRFRRQFTESRQSRMSETAGSDHIVRWNTAKDISESQLETAPARPRAASAAVDMGSFTHLGRKWSWAPRDEAEPWWPTESHDETNPPATWDRKMDKASAATALESHLASTIDRRLAQTRQMIEAKKEARRQRRNLKESGDYLGVQGINPETGQLDIITPTDSDRSTTSQETQQRLNILRSALKDARHSYKQSKAQNETAAKKVLLASEKHKLRRLEQDKQTVKTISQSVKWRRHTKQWSSAQEPELSPIAQSRAGSVAGSLAHVRNAGRPSKHRTMEQAERATDESLIALDSPARELTPRPMHAPEARPHAERVVDTPSSTATVIRTPHRQSLADLTPSAWELFANGISFDGSESSSARGHQDVPVSPRASVEEDCTPAVGRSAEAASSPGHMASRDIPLLQITTPGKTTVKLADSPAKTPTKVSFLDRRAKRQIDPGGRDTKNLDLPAGSRAAVHVSQQTLSPKRSFSLLRRKTGLTPPQPPDLNPRESVERDSATSRKRSGTLEAATRDTLAEIRMQTPAGRSPLRRFMPAYGTFKMRRRDESRNRHGSEEEVSLSALHPVTSLGQTQKCRSLEPTRTFLALKPAAVAQELMAGNPASAGDMTRSGTVNPRENSNNMKLLELPGGHSAQNQSNADDEWIENAIRDITNKGNEFTDECVSTPITITTGSDHPTSSWNLAKRLEESPKGPQRPARRRQLSRVMYNLPDLGPPDGSPMATVMRRSPSASPSATQGGWGEATDTTSTGHVEATKQQTETVAMRYSKRTGTGEKQGVMQCSTSPKSTYMPWADKTLGDDKRANLAAVQETGQKGDLGETLPEGRGERPMDTRPDGLEEWSLTVRVPGGFPAHLGAEDGIGGLFRGTGAEAEGSLWTAVKEASWSVHCHATALLALYWEMVGPVFDSGSEYWERNARNDATLVDGFALVLAVPGAILGTVVLV